MLAPLSTSEEEDGITRAERRHGARHRLTMRVAKLGCRNGEYACIVHDVSPTGARLRLFHDHPPDSHMYLELADGQLYAAERRWIDGDFAGCRFSSRIDIDDFLGDGSALPRRPVRLRIARPARFVTGGELGHAYTVNLSAQGACIEAGRQIPLGSLLRLEIDGAAPQVASVCWRQDFRHGLAFQEALPLDEFARLALALQPFDAAPATADATGPARAIGA